MLRKSNRDDNDVYEASHVHTRKIYKCEWDGHTCLAMPRYFTISQTFNGFVRCMFIQNSQMWKKRCPSNFIGENLCTPAKISITGGKVRDILHRLCLDSAIWQPVFSNICLSKSLLRQRFIPAQLLSHWRFVGLAGDSHTGPAILLLIARSMNTSLHFSTKRIDRFYLRYQFAITELKRVEMQTHEAFNAQQWHLKPFQWFF